jgi:hypothetical protein
MTEVGFFVDTPCIAPAVPVFPAPKSHPAERDATTITTAAIFIRPHTIMIVLHQMLGQG